MMFATTARTVKIPKIILSIMIPSIAKELYISVSSTILLGEYKQCYNTKNGASCTKIALIAKCATYLNFQNIVSYTMYNKCMALCRGSIINIVSGKINVAFTLHTR